jgi:uncharacterized phage infection (PIP) family protein YhgE
MRRILFPILGLLEAAIAAVLVYLGGQLPSSDEIGRGFQGAQRVTDRAGTQVLIFRRQVQDLRRPELQQLAARMQKQTQLVTHTLRQQQVDFETVGTMRDALGEVAAGLDGLADTMDPASVRRLGDGLAETATFLEDKVVPGAARAADDIEASTEALRVDSQRLGALLRQAPLDLKAAREIHDSLGRFGDGLERMNGLLKVQRLDAMRDGFRGLDDALATGADQVERLAGYTYPAIEFNGLKPEVSQKQFWPEGEKIAAGMRKAAAGASAAGKEMDGLTKELPELRTALDESRKVVLKTREALAVALAQQNKLEPLLKDAPEHAAKLAEDLPKIGQDLARVLRDTKQMKNVASALRQAQQGLETTVARWPELRKALTNSAALLRATRDQLDGAMQHRHDYETAMKQSVLLADSFAATLPLMTEQLDSRLDEEEHALHELGQSLEDVQSALPAYEHTTQQMFRSGRLLAWLAAAVIGLHGCYLTLSVGLGRRYSL